jgi:AcrR family transcriptional regulator
VTLADAALPAVQARSQRTRDRLLDAAEALLREGGPEKATVPAIARRARVAIGSVYRRFPDKDAVLRSIYERFFTRGIAANRHALAEARWRGVPLEPLVRRLVDGMVHGYRFHAPLLAALLRYVDSHPDAEFRQHAEELRAEAFASIRQLLWARREEIAHPNAEQAIEFLFQTLGLLLKGFLLQGDRFGKPVSWPDLTTELQRLAVGYLTLTTSAPQSGAGTPANS